MKYTNLLKFAALFFCAIFLVSCAQRSYLDYSKEPDPESTTEEESADERDYSPSDIYVQITGAVNAPGVYSVAEGSRLFEVVELAGGLRSDAADDGVNQAGEVKDGQSIRIPTVDELALAAADTGSGGIASDGRVNINSASMDELMSLPGIGESKAKLIIDYRESNGSYTAIEDIMNIQGIKDGVFSKIKDNITVGY